MRFPHAEGYEDLAKILSGDVLQFQRYTDGGFLFYHWVIYIGPFKHAVENGEEIILSMQCHTYQEKIISPNTNASRKGNHAHFLTKGQPLLAT
jgi:hypothetical protein